MGTPLTANEPGNLCIVCWGPGKTFGPAPTPAVITLTLSGLLPGEFWDPDDEPNLLTPHLLEQTGLPCLFNIIDGDFTWNVNWNPTNTTITVNNRFTLRLVFNALIFTPCLLSAGNTTPFAGNIATGGTATITWSLGGL